MIDPKNITNFKQDKYELEEFVLFWIFAAGKNGVVASKLLENFLQKINGNKKPFLTIKNNLNSILEISNILKKCRVGCYNNKAKTIFELVNSKINLKNCLVDDLEKIYGIGKKTSRCFLIHSRENIKLAGLDTHILKFLKDNKIKNVPKSTPQSKKEYLRLEKEFLKICEKQKKEPYILDLEVWNFYRGK